MNRLDAQYYRTTAETWIQGHVSYNAKCSQHLLIREAIEQAIEANMYPRVFVIAFQTWISQSETMCR